jgi:HEAT repeat protein
MLRVLVVSLAIMVPMIAHAQAPTRERVRAMLSGIEDVPTEAQWRQVGDGALPILIDLYNTPSEPPFIRLRAVSAVAAFPQPAVRTFLLAVARAERQGDLYVREAVISLARAFGRAAIADLTPFLDHGEPVVREATANALGRIGGADRQLRARLNVEENALVREALQRAVR